MPNPKEKTSFIIRNTSDHEMTIAHEPEAFEFQLPVNEEVIIETDSCEESVLLNTSIINGKIFIAIYDDKSQYRVYHNDKDVFDWI